MSDTIDGFRALKEYRRAKRLIWGVPCPICREKLPKANAKILEPLVEVDIDGNRIETAS